MLGLHVGDGRQSFQLDSGSSADVDSDVVAHWRLASAFLLVLGLFRRGIVLRLEEAQWVRAGVLPSFPCRLIITVLIFAVFLPLPVEDQLLDFRDQGVAAGVGAAAELPTRWK